MAYIHEGITINMDAALEGEKAMELETSDPLPGMKRPAQNP
jgi:hypothetical protein